ncbi:MAG TPA: molecular chaperone TorD family protein [Symbiobacteriaceae bacterium]|jgi:TorA maturation chaperone TorD|nr:molecular chaperone TorD family protein [Symbiobacteriaceae bacterium]
MTMVLDPVAPAQAVLYRYLTEGFSLPSAERLEYLESALDTARMACFELLETGEATGPLPDLDALQRAVKAARESSLEELQGEYTRLFVAGMPTTPLRLVEAVQREGMLVGQATEAVATMYWRFGLEVTDREPDHLTAELEFLTYLTGTPVAAGKESERYRRARLKFLREHLLAWGPQLASKLSGETREPLFLAMAGLLDWVLKAEATAKV